MGMYTGLRAKVIVKEQYRSGIAALSEGYGWDHRLPGVAKWLEYDRHNFIPFGGLSYMRLDFSPTGESFNKFDEKSGLWEFYCSLKNYNDEIEYFVPMVLMRICSEFIFCQSLYEESHDYTDYYLPNIDERVSLLIDALEKDSSGAAECAFRDYLMETSREKEFEDFLNYLRWRKK